MIPSVRINNDITIEFDVFRNDEPEDFTEAVDVSAKLIGQVYGDIMLPVLNITGNKVTIKCLAEQQKKCDSYSLCLTYKKPNIEREPLLQPFTIDAPVFKLVKNSIDVTEPDETEITVQTIRLNGVMSVNQNGARGMSAYEVWKNIEDNEEKTEEDFFTFLKKPVADYVENITFTYSAGKLIITY